MKISWGNFLVIAWLLVLVNSHYIARFEGIFLPVIVEFDYSTQVSSDGTSVVNGSFYKIRNCELINLEWRYSNENLGEIPITVFFDIPPVFDEGYHRFDKWTLNLSKNLVDNNSEIYAVHSCHPFWDTITKIHGSD